MEIEFTLVVPVVTFREGNFASAIGRRIEREIDICERQLHKTHRTWTTQPTWHKDFHVKLGAGATVRGFFGRIQTDDDKYNLVAKGTGRHVIPAGSRSHSGRRFLRYRRNFRPKTRPRVIGSHSGGKFGDFTMRENQVTHPGSAAREFHLEIAERRQRAYNQAMANEFRHMAGAFFASRGRRLGRI